MNEKVNHLDLHCHTHCSDGQLSPSELLMYALEKNISLLAITDHDTISAFEQIQCLEGIEQINQHSFQFKTLQIMTGVEISCSWYSNDIHLVGLGIDLDNSAFNEFLKTQKKIRENRFWSLIDYLESLQIKHIREYFEFAIKNQQNQTDVQYGRRHLADYLVENNYVNSHKQAFKLYLAYHRVNKIIEDAPWTSLEDAIDVIRQSSGFSVLAHPFGYKFKKAKLNQLFKFFAECQGNAIEISSGLQNNINMLYLIEQCKKYNFEYSCGSDFHEMGKQWSDLGVYSFLPEQDIKNLNAIWESFGNPRQSINNN